VRQFDYKAPFDDLEPDEVLAAVDKIQRSIMIIGLIEDAAALPRLDAILETDIDGLFPGSTDIAFTLGRPDARLRPHHPDVQAAIELVVEKCRQHGKPAMFGNLSALQTGGLSPSEAIAVWAAKGIGIFQASVDLEIILRWSQGFLREVRDVHVDGFLDRSSAST
jgi:2-keto-3-deoxy-L-rhamnonate aldolase RhmA